MSIYLYRMSRYLIFKATVAELVDFFIYIQKERYCKSNPITGYRSAKAFIQKGLRKSSIKLCSEKTKLVKGICNS